jgi:hypothetical protein
MGILVSHEVYQREALSDALQVCEWHELILSIPHKDVMCTQYSRELLYVVHSHHSELITVKIREAMNYHFMFCIKTS